MKMCRVIHMRDLITAVVGVMMAWQAGEAQAAGCGCSVCAGGCAPAFELVERTIQVPTMVMERRTIHVTECRTEPRQRTITVNKCVPETQQVTENYTVMVPEVRVRTEKYHVQKAVWREVEHHVTVQVPHPEKRQGVRKVCRQVQMDEMRTVCRDMGHWEEVVCDAGCGTVSSGCGDCGTGCGGRLLGRRCGGCGGCGSAVACGGCGGCGGYDAGCGKVVAQHTHRVWRPNVVTEQVPVKVWRSVMVDEPFEYTTTVYRPEVRVQKSKVCEYVPEERVRDVRFTVCVPQQRTRVRNVTTYRMVSEPRVENFLVRVPYTVTKEVDVPVCRLMPKTVVCRVPVSVPCGGGNGCGGVGCGGCGACR
ncbi:MAG: hypothetical protein AB7F89_04960 [Pirellulaceae bacterium]